jgi:hypothetical protein
LRHGKNEDARALLVVPVLLCWKKRSSTGFVQFTELGTDHPLYERPCASSSRAPPLFFRTPCETLLAYALNLRFNSRARLEAENLVLRQQLNVPMRKLRDRPR